jgi:hypothetical protein
VVASLLVALAVGGWFHTLVADVPLARLSAYGGRTPGRAPNVALAGEIVGADVRAKPGDAVRFRFPPVFGALQTGLSLAGAGENCTAKFAVRSATTELWRSGPVTAGGQVERAEVPLAPGDTDVTLVAEGDGCPPSSVATWVAPTLVPWRATTDWGSRDVLYLSDLPSATHGLRALLESADRWRRDRSVKGNPIVIGGRRFARGIGVQADSVVSFPVPTGASALVTGLGYDDGVGPQGPSAAIRFAILVDGHEAYRSPTMSPGQRVDDVRVPVAGATTVTLIVEGPSPNPFDHAGWGDARFVRDAS